MQGSRKKRVLVTGGAGFLGSHLCERLLRAGCKVICADDFSSGHAQNVSGFAGNPDFELIRHDIIEPLDVQADEIFNLACPASPVHYQSDPVRTAKTNAFGAANMLDLARKTGARIFQASTSEVYGNPHVHPQTEDYWGNVNPIGIRACYDEGKRLAETLFMDHRRSFGMVVKIVRIFNTYGPRMHPDDGRVVSNFIVQALKGEDITIYGDGQQTRSFCYVDDLIEGFIRMMETPDHVTGPVNLGNPGEFTILQLAEMVLSMTGSNSRLVFLPLPQDDPTQRKPDITAAGTLLDWTPKVELAEGLDKTITHFRTLLQT